MGFQRRERARTQKDSENQGKMTMSHHRSSVQRKGVFRVLKRVRPNARRRRNRSHRMAAEEINAARARLEPNRDLPTFSIPVMDKGSKEIRFPISQSAAQLGLF